MEFTVSGRVSQEDYDAVLGSLHAFIDRHGGARILEVSKQLDEIAPSLLTPEIQTEGWGMPQVSHVAVVSDSGWFSPVVRAAGGQAGTRLRLFQLDELDSARSWLQDPFSHG